MKKVKAYPALHQHGTISLENLELTLPKEPTNTGFEGSKSLMLTGDIGVQIAEDGRIWICINGIAFLRFSPHPNGKMQK